jgi:hypothetical protein
MIGKISVLAAAAGARTSIKATGRPRRNAGALGLSDDARSIGTS